MPASPGGQRDVILAAIESHDVAAASAARTDHLMAARDGITQWMSSNPGTVGDSDG